MATETTGTSAWAWRPDLSEVAPRDAIPGALVLSTTTVAGFVEGDEASVRVQYVDDATAGFVDEGAAIDEADPDLAEAVVFTGKVAQLIKLSREQFVQPNAQALLAESVSRAVTTAANKAFLTQAAPVSPAVTPPAGLLNITGVEDGGAVADNLDALIDLAATLAGNGADPSTSTVILAPDAWASLRKFKAATGSSQSLIGAGTHDAQKFLLDMPVIVTNAMSSGNGLIVDRTAVVSAVGRVLVAQSEHAYFASDSVGIRATFRFGANAVRADRIGKFSVTDPDAV